MATRTVSVDLRAKVGNYVSGMKQAEAATERVEKATRLAKVQMTAMGVAGAAAGAYIAAQFARKIITAASDLNETVNKSSVVFGKNAAAMQAWSKTAATSFGMSQNAALGAASTYGNLFVSLGLGQDESAKMSKRLVELAGDLASFNNVDPTAALDALRSGLVGEQEPLRKLGISLQEATLKQKALDMGLVDSTKGVLPPAIKAQAAYALILEQSKTAQGDFKRTSGDLANQQRILNAQWDDAQASLGQALLPVMTDAVTVMNDMLEAWNALPQPMQTATVGVVGLTAALVYGIPKVAEMKAALNGLGIAGGGAARNILAVSSAVAAIVAMKVGADWLREWAGYTAKGGDEASSALEGVRSTAQLTEEQMKSLGVAGLDLSDAMEQTFNRSAWQNFLNAPNVMDHLGISEDVVDEWDKFAKSADAGLSTLMVKGGPAAEAAKSLFADIVRQMTEHGATQEQITKQFPLMTGAIASTGESLDDYAKKVDTADTKTRTFAESLTDLNSVAVGAMQAQLGVSQAAQTLAQSMMENGNSFNIATAAGMSNMQALLGVTDAINQHAAAVYTQTGSVGQAVAALETERIALIRNLTATGMTSQAANTLVNQFLKVPAAAYAAANGLAAAATAALQTAGAMGAAAAAAAFGNPSAAVNVGFNVAKVPKVSAPKVATPKAPKVSQASTFRPPSAGIMDGFDPNAYANAVKRSRAAVKSVTEATLALADARRKVNEAGSPSEQAEALREQAQAEADLAAAKREVAAADKAKAAEKSPGKSILGDFKDRARKLDTFRRNLKILAKRGLSRTIIMQMLEAGIDDGGAMAAALVKDGNIAQLNRTQRMIAQDQRALGIAYGDNATSSSDGGSGGTTGTTGSSSASVVLSFQNASRPIVLKMDSTQVWKGLLALRRSNGGASLGLG